MYKSSIAKLITGTFGLAAGLTLLGFGVAYKKYVEKEELEIISDDYSYPTSNTDPRMLESMREIEKIIERYKHKTAYSSR